MCGQGLDCVGEILSEGDAFAFRALQQKLPYLPSGIRSLTKVCALTRTFVSGAKSIAT